MHFFLLQLNPGRSTFSKHYSSTSGIDSTLVNWIALTGIAFGVYIAIRVYISLKREKRAQLQYEKNNGSSKKGTPAGTRKRHKRKTN